MLAVQHTTTILFIESIYSWEFQDTRELPNERELE